MNSHKHFEGYAINRYPRKGRCKNSVFANGWHRVGLVPVESALDGGASGDFVNEICLECEKVMRKRWFILIPQPNKLKANTVEVARDE